jgi:hypothetical protein
VVEANLGIFNKANDFDFEFLEPNTEGQSSVVEFSAKECEELVPFGTIYQVSQDSKVDWAIVTLEDEASLGDPLYYGFTNTEYDALKISCSTLQDEKVLAVKLRQVLSRTKPQPLSNTDSMLMQKSAYHDAGACVQEPGTGEVKGHIVTGYPGTKFACMVPVGRILGDIERRLGCQVHMYRTMQWMDPEYGEDGWNWAGDERLPGYNYS